MALVHADNFSIYGTDTSLLLDGIYAEEGNLSLSTDPDGISGGRVVNVFNNSTNGEFVALRYALPAGDTTKVGIPFRVWLTSLPTIDAVGPHIAQWRTSGNSALADLRVTSNGRLSMIITGGSTYTTTTPVVTANGWYHIEAVYTHGSGALCSFEVRVEGITVLTQTDVAATNADVGQLRVTGQNSGTTIGPRYYIKDYVVWDDNGTYNTDFLGSVLVTNLTPTSDVSLNWTPSSGTTGYEILDNIPPVDTTYIYAEDAPLPSPYVATLSDLPSEVTSVKGLITFVRAAKSDGGDGSLQVGLISDPDGTPATVLGTDRPITVAQTYWRDVFEEDPATTAPWIPAAVNEVELQIDRTT